VLTHEPEIIEKYVRPGKLKLVFRDVLNHGERSLRTSEAAACAGQQGHFWPMHGLLFENQSKVWSTGNDGLLDLMLTFAAEVKELEQTSFSTCMQERRTLAALQAADAEQRERGVTIQPVFEIGNQRFIGLQPVDTMLTFIEDTVK
jgi:protein-disulfide isomerase